jgi:hypothetical protein
VQELRQLRSYQTTCDDLPVMFNCDARLVQWRLERGVEKARVEGSATIVGRCIRRHLILLESGSCVWLPNRTLLSYSECLTTKCILLAAVTQAVLFTVSE